MTQAIWRNQLFSVEETLGDYVVLRDCAYATATVSLADPDLIVDPPNGLIAQVDRGEPLTRCPVCRALHCLCASIAELMDEFGLTGGIMH